MNKLKIYCCYHKEEQLLNDGNTWFYAKGTFMNDFINEISMFYHIYENDKDSDYIGTCHYRRIILPEEVNLNLVTDKSAVGYELHPVKKKGEAGLEAFAHVMQADYLFSDFVEYTIQKYGENNIYLLKDKEMSTTGEWTILRNSFVLTRAMFFDLCDFMFGFIDYHDKKHNLNYNADNYKKEVNEWLCQLEGDILYKCLINDRYRLVGFFLEKLTDVYLQTHLENFYAI